MASQEARANAKVGPGVQCPHCHCGYCPVRHTETRTITFHGRKHTVIRRKRVCQHCNLPFTTVETHEDENIMGLPAITPLFSEQLQKIREGELHPGGDGSSLPKKTPGDNPYLD